MSRSYRKAIIKDKPSHYKISQFANKIIRRVQKYFVRNIANLSDMEDYNIPNHHEIFNDYDYCDYRFTPEYDYKGKNKTRDVLISQKKWRRK